MSEENEEGLFVNKQGKKCSWRLKKKEEKTRKKIFGLKKEEWEERWEREFQMPYKNRDRLCYNENRREIRKLKKTFGKMPLWF